MTKGIWFAGHSAKLSLKDKVIVHVFPEDGIISFPDILQNFLICLFCPKSLLNLKSHFHFRGVLHASVMYVEMGPVTHRLLTKNVC